MTATLIKTTPTPAHLTAQQNAKRLEAALNAAFYERQKEIRFLIISLIARQHVILLGPPGTAKSHLTNTFGKALDYTGAPSTTSVKNPAPYWSYLFGRFTLPEEVFGPFSLPMLEKGVQTRVTTGKMPECRVAFLDEGFKANSAILNNLLTILNERWFDNPTRQDVPLEMCVIASNELPEGGAEGELGALFDRFLVRLWVSPIKNRDNLRALLLDAKQPEVTERLTAADIADLRVAADSVSLAGVVDLMLDLKDHLEQEHSVVASDRRWLAARKLVKASAAFSGRTIATPEDLLVLGDCLWNERSEIATISGAVSKIADADMAEALELRDAALELFSKVNTSKNATDLEVAAATKTAASINEILAEMRRLQPTSASEDAVARLMVEVDGMANAIAALMNARMGW